MQPDRSIYRAKAWAVALLLTLAALGVVIATWAFAVAYLRPIIGFGAYVVVAAVAAVLSIGVGRAIRWLANG